LFFEQLRTTKKKKMGKNTQTIEPPPGVEPGISASLARRHTSATR
jgi:hypothetical protein